MQIRRFSRYVQWIPIARLVTSSWNFEYCSAVSSAVQQGRHEKASKKKYSPNPLSATSVCFGFVNTNHIKGNVYTKLSMVRTVNDSLEERE